MISHPLAVYLGATALTLIPAFAADTFSNAVDTDITEDGNWASGTAPIFGTDTGVRWTIEGNTTYTASQGTTGIGGAASADVRGLKIDDFTFEISGGALNVTNTSAAFMGDIADNSVLTVSGGSLSFTGDFSAGLRSNAGGTAVWTADVNVTGGTMSVGGNLDAGRGLNNERTNPLGTTTSLDVTSGALIVTGDVRSGSWSSDNNTLDINVSGGSFSADEIINYSAGTLSVDLSGGSTTTFRQLRKNGGGSPGDINVTIDGATLKGAAAGDTSFLDSTITSVSVGSGGAILDSNGASQTIGAGISGSAGGDVTFSGGGEFILKGASTYDGATVISGSTTLTVNGIVNELPDTTTITVGANSTLNMVSADTVDGLAGSGTIDLTSAFITANTITWGGDLVIDIASLSNYGVLNNLGTALDLSTITLSGTSVATGTFGDVLNVITGSTTGSLSNAEALTPAEIAALDGAGFTGLTDAITLSGERYALRYGSLDLITIPEPSLALLGGLGGILALLRRRRA